MPSVMKASETETLTDSLSGLSAICGPKRTLTSWHDRIAYASDASFYHLVPAAVVQPKDLSELRALLAYSQAHSLPLTFRTAGTSLSGQAITDGLLVDLSKHWRGVEVREQGAAIWVQPGVIGAHANLLLRDYRRKIGPDPASITACMLGGILANNASGMCCGVSQNAYHTLRSLAFVLPNGLSFDTAQPADYSRFDAECPEIAAELLALRQQLLNKPDLTARIRAKYRQKNTTGYSLNAFLDYQLPLDILAHLLIGSEGTLAMISEAVLNTVPDKPFKYTGLMIFASIKEACEALPDLQQSGAEAIELLDDASLRALPPISISPWLAEVPAGACALLVEYQAQTAQDSELQAERAADLLEQFTLLAPPRFSREPEQQALLWKLRKGLYPSVGAVRASGSTVLIEDVVFPIEHLPEAVQGLHRLFQAHGYPEAIIFGHAKDGNLHFVLTQSFNTETETARYDALMQDLTQLVLRLDGGLKAEHGTGRNMAPFVEAEWGPEAYQIMLRLKRVIDPENLLNPGVIINASPKAHLEHLKQLPGVDAEVDRCTECGFCEPVCPSRRVTLTPRQRIVLRREMQRLQAAGEQAKLSALKAQYQYSGIETCAADSLCSLACPIGIDTGALVKRLRSEQVPEPTQRQVSRLGRRFSQLETGIKLGLGSARIAEKIIGERGINWLIGRAEAVTGTALPYWDHRLPTPNLSPLPETTAQQAEAVYFPSCLSRTMGYAGQDPLPQTFLKLTGQAGLKVWLPEESVGHCCGLPFSSKGFAQAGQTQAERTLARFWAWSHHGKIPVVVDTSPCTLQLKQALDKHPEYSGLQLLDAVDYFDRYVIDQLPIQKRPDHTVLHPVCSLRKLGLESALVRLAERCSERVSVPISAGCCGYAGDRGLLFPELPAAALADEQLEIQVLNGDHHCSSSRSCEMGLSVSLDKPFVSFLHLLQDHLGPEAI